VACGKEERALTTGGEDFAVKPGEAKIRVEKLSEVLLHHQRLYHVEDAPTISDGAYDSLLRELISLEEEYPEFKSSDSPSDRVGGK
jgi:DNA ligase (NAD+)